MRCTPEVVAVLLANSRTPAERRGDLDAQLGANRLGVARLIEVEAAGVGFEEVCAYGERRMRAALAGIPDGSWTFADVLEAPAGGGPPRIKVRLTVDGSEATFDFTGTSPEQSGNVNAVEAVTLSAVAFALRAATDATIPAGGSLRPVRVVAPAGTIVAARPPAAVGAGNVEVSQRVADVCLGALAQALPGRIGAAGQGTMNNVMIGGAGWVYYETIAGGEGGRLGRRGMSGVHTAMTNTKNTPIEALERELPMRVRRYRLRSGSGGAGRWPGGDGVEREIEVLEAATLSVIGERRTSRPWGQAGGGAGESGEWWLLPGGDPTRSRRLPARTTVRLQPGDVLRVLTPGGGGYGKPGAG
jgi:N-methylhydantoinase B/oxoprolinase/acetone carboxylase alpha subunit